MPDWQHRKQAGNEIGTLAGMQPPSPTASQRTVRDARKPVGSLESRDAGSTRPAPSSSSDPGEVDLLQLAEHLAVEVLNGHIVAGLGRVRSELLVTTASK